MTMDRTQADKANLRPSLARQIARSATLLTLGLLLVVGGLSIYLIRQEQTKAHQALVATNLQLKAARMSSQIKSIAEQISKASESSLIATALVDSLGKDAYLVPYLQGFWRVNGVPLALVFTDFEGQEIARNGRAGLSDVHFEWVKQRLATNKPGAEVFTSNGKADLVVVEFVYYSRTRTPEGALLYLMHLGDLEEEGVRLRWNGDDAFFAESMKLAAANQTDFKPLSTVLSLPAPLDSLGFRVEELTPTLPPNLSGLGVYLPALLAVALATAVAMVLIRRSAERLTADLRGLSVLATEAKANGFDAKVEFKGESREAAELASSLNTMVERLNALHDQLKDESERKFQTLVENLPGAAFLRRLDEPWTMRYVSSGVQQLTGVPAAELVDDALVRYGDLLSQADRFRIEEAMIQASQGSLYYVGEYDIARRDGVRCWVWERGQITTDSQGQRWISGVLLDISARKAAESQLLKAKDAAEAANVAKSQFLATMSHEIRTPLNGILGMASLLQAPSMSESESREYGRIVFNSGQNLLALLNDILDLSKVEAGKLDLSLAPTSMAELVAQVSSLYKEAAHQKGLDFHSEWLGNPEGSYLLDAVRVRQMVANLLSNAIKFTSSGQVNLRVEPTVGHDGQAMLKFSVLDSGPGVAMDQVGRLFKPFSQLDSSSTRRHGGTGLGLSIVGRLAQLMGGDVGYMANNPMGSVFWFTVRAKACVAPDSPAAPVDTADMSTVTSTSHMVSVPPTDNAGKSTFTVLVVEDNLTNQLVVTALLKRLKVPYVVKENGQEAVDYFARACQADPEASLPGLILMDCEMPVLDGFEATRQIRALETEYKLPRTLIYALTARAFESDRLLCLESGMDDVITKPVDMRSLSARVLEIQRQLEAV